METQSSKSKPIVQVFKCHHCKFEAKTKAGLTKHINKKHDGKKTKVGGHIEGEVKILTPQQERFCELWASDKEFFGNGVQSYIEAYEIDVGKGKGQKSYEYCKFQAHKLLTSSRILKRINEIFEGRGLNDTFVDKQLEKLITQDAEFRPKLGAIQEYNKLKKRTVDTLQHVHAYADISKMTDEEIRKEKERLQSFFNKK